MKIMKIERREEINHRNIIKVGFFEKGRKALNIEKIEKIKEITRCLMEIPS